MGKTIQGGMMTLGKNVRVGYFPNLPVICPKEGYFFIKPTLFTNVSSKSSDWQKRKFSVLFLAAQTFRTVGRK